MSSIYLLHIVAKIIKKVIIIYFEVNYEHL